MRGSQAPSRADLEKGGDELGGFAHGAPYAGHPVAAAVALEVLEIIEWRNLLARVREEVGPSLQAKGAGYAGHPLVRETEQRLGVRRGPPLIPLADGGGRGGARALRPLDR